MKVLHYSDKSSPDFLSFYDQCEILFSTGDLSKFDFTGLEDILNKKPAFGIYGNHDSGRYLDELGIINVHHKIITWDGLKIGGFQGCLKYKEGSLLFTEDEAKIFADTFPYVDILLLHVAPRGMLDDPSDQVHIGSRDIRRYVLEKQPRFVFCGHQYSDDFMQNDRTKIYRTYGARIIEI